jgi:hypothetical protein
MPTRLPSSTPRRLSPHQSAQEAGSDGCETPAPEGCDAARLSSSTPGRLSLTNPASTRPPPSVHSKVRPNHNLPPVPVTFDLGS